MAEADVACAKWASGRGEFRYKFQVDFGGDVSIRNCRHEEETNQFLGYEYPYKEGFLLEGSAPWGDDKVVKRFRY